MHRAFGIPTVDLPGNRCCRAFERERLIVDAGVKGTFASRDDSVLEKADAVAIVVHAGDAVLLDDGGLEPAEKPDLNAVDCPGAQTLISDSTFHVISRKIGRLIGIEHD